MNRWIAVAAALSVAFAAVAAQAGGWTQPAGDLYVKAWNRLIRGGTGFFTDGDTAGLDGTFTDWSLNVYAEYGLLEGTTLVLLATPAGYADFEGEHTGYVGPIVVGARQRLYAGPVQLAVEGHYGYAPGVGEEAIGEGVAQGQGWVYVPAVETHRLDAEVQLGAGFFSFWASLAAGVRWYSRDGFDPAIQGTAQIGYAAPFGLVVDAHLGLLEPLGDIDAANVSGAGETRYLGFGIAASYWLTDAWAINAGFDSAFYASANAAAAPFTLGVEYRGF